MPEGDVVLRTARRLHAALAGRLLIRSDLRWPSLATVELAGREVDEVVAVGKHLLIRLGGMAVDPPASSSLPGTATDATAGSPGTATEPSASSSPPGTTADRMAGLTLHSHLRMDGSWHVFRTGEHWSGVRPEHGIRVVLANDRWTAVGHRLGMLDLVATMAEDSIIGHLGPDILGPDWNAGLAVTRIASHPDRTIGESLLDQRMLAGIGTFFMSETCFLRGVSPWRPVREVADLAALVNLAHRLMTSSIENAPQVTTGDARRGHEQWVHSRSGRPCRRCGTTIRVAQLGTPPIARVAFWCPACQPGTVPTDSGAPQRPLGAQPRQQVGTQPRPRNLRRGAR